MNNTPIKMSDTILMCNNKVIPYIQKFTLTVSAGNLFLQGETVDTYGQIKKYLVVSMSSNPHTIFELRELE